MSAALLVPTCLASFSVQSGLYGVFATLFCTSTCLMVQRQQLRYVGASRPPLVYKTPYFLAGVALFVTVTMHWIMVLYRSLQAFSPSVGGISEPLPYFATLGTALHVTQVAALLLTVFICDAIIVYRVWIIWGRDYRMALFPLITFLVGDVVIVIVLWKLRTFNTPEDLLLYDSVLGAWIKADLIITILTNSSSSGLIAWKLWRMKESLPLSASRQRTMSWYLGVIIEMAALYVAVTLVYFISNLTGSTIQFIFEDNMAPAAGIAFMLINVRVGMGYATQPPSSGSDESSSDTLRTSRPAAGGPFRLPVHAVAIDTVHAVEQDGEYEMNHLRKPYARDNAE